MKLPLFELSRASDLRELPWYRKLRQSAAMHGQEAQTVATIISDVQTRGDEAVVEYMRRWTDPQFGAERIRVSQTELKEAKRQLTPVLRKTLLDAISNVKKYQEHIRPKTPRLVQRGGAELGLRFLPVASVGLAVPGGRAAYPSTVIMLAVPALAAGVPADRISVVTPPPTQQSSRKTIDVSPLVLATCALLGLSRVYRIGGAQAIAALALGTKTVEPVDMIVGPGNIYTQLAKVQLSGQVGIDGFLGPSEIVTIADKSANVRHVAADLIAQAEHDPGKCFLVCWSRQVIEKINEEIEQQIDSRRRRAAIEAALAQESAALLVPDSREALAVANLIAPEHLNLAVANPDNMLSRVQHAGEIFLGDRTAVASGDYWAGPSHCLPTGTTARFNSGVSVYTFLKRTGTVAYRKGMPAKAVNAIARLAEAEGLDGHAASVRARRTP